MPLEGRNHLDSVGMLRLWRPRGSPSADEVAVVADEVAADKGEHELHEVKRESVEAEDGRESVRQ